MASKKSATGTGAKKATAKQTPAAKKAAPKAAAAKKAAPKAAAAKKAAPKAATAKKAAPKAAAAKKAAPKAAAAKKVAAKKVAASAPPARRMAAKVSPLRGMPIDAFIAQKVKGWQAELLRRLIALFQSVAPEMSTVIKWGQPTFELNGPFAYVKPAKAHVTVGFWRGIELADPTGLLGEGERMRHFKLTAPEQLDEAVVRGLVKQAVEHNLAQGDPTKRAMKKK